MKIDLCISGPVGPILIAWARETKLGVYMGVRFSPEVENVSYFVDGNRQLLRFPVSPEGNRVRVEVPLAPRPAIDSIADSELILARTVDLSQSAEETAPQVSAPDTLVIVIPRRSLSGCKTLEYEAHIIRAGGLTVPEGPNFEMQRPFEWTSEVHPLACFPNHVLLLRYGAGRQA